MKKLKIFALVLLLANSFWSCEKDDNSSSKTSDSIVGYWRIFKRYENNLEVPLIDCDRVWITEYDQTYYNKYVQENADPTPGVICGRTPATMVKWVKISSNSYELRRSYDNELFGTAVINGGILVEEFAYSNEKLELKRISL